MNRNLPRTVLILGLLWCGVSSAQQRLTFEQQQQLQEVNRLEQELGRLQAEGRYAEAAVPGKRAAMIRQSILGNEHLDTALSFNYVGIVLKQAANYEEARKYFEQSLAIRRRLLGQEHPLVAESLNNLGTVFISQGDYDAAQRHLEQSLQIRKRTIGEEHADTAYSTNNLAFVLQKQGDFAAARSYYEQTLAIRQKVYGEDHPLTASAFGNLGMLLLEAGELAAAKPNLERALAITRRVQGESHPDTADYLSNVGGLLEAQVDYSGALRAYEQVLVIRQRVLGEEHPRTAASHQMLGLLRQKMGDYPTARDHLETALAIRQKVLGEEHPITAFSLNNLARVVGDLGDQAAARRNFERALAILEKVLGRDHPETAKTRSNLAGVLQTQGDHTAARNRFEEALESTIAAKGNDHPDTATMLNNLASLLSRQGDEATALSYHEQALAIRTKMLGDDHPDTVVSLNNLGSLHFSRGEYAVARSHYERALAAYSEVLGEDHPDTAMQMGNLARLEAIEGNWAEARDLIDRERRNLRTHIGRALPGLSHQEQLIFLKQDEGSFHAALSLGLLRRETPEAAAASASWLINGKGVSQEALAARELLARDLDDPRSQELAEQLRETRRKLANLAVSVPDPAQADARKEAIATLTQEEQQLSRKLVQVAGQVANTGQWVELDQVRTALAADEVLLNIARFAVFDFAATKDEPKWQPARYVVWMIPPAGQGEVEIVDLGLADEIDTLVKQARDAVGEAGKKDGLIQRKGEDVAEEQMRESLQQITEKIWQPLGEKLSPDTKRVLLSPDGALWLLPWSALPLEEETFLIESYSLRYLISGRELVMPEGKSVSNPSLLFADPAFDLSPDKVRAATKAIFRSLTFEEDTHRGLVSQTSLGRVPPLPNTQLEALAISPSVEKMTGKSPIKYLGQYALESVVKRVKRPQMMVLSTHGFFLPDQDVKPSDDPMQSDGTRSSALLTAGGEPIENPLLRCGLLLAGCNQLSSGGDDGILTGMEIVGLDLRGTDLVVLSACETGIGKVQAGEGVAGLRQAFQLAGANAVVSTLWQVPDRDSAIIMKDFFENLASDQAQAEALRSAQLKRIETRRRRYGAAHPFFWAAWTTTGK